MVQRFLWLIIILFITACATKVLKYDKVEQLKEIKEFEKAVDIVAPEELPPAIVPGRTTTTVPVLPPAAKKKPKKPALERRQPPLESDLGFEGRRPLKDPFRVGEKVLHDVTYLGMKAGTLTLEVRPMATVNGKKSYNFRIAIASSALFSSFYNVDDSVTTLVDYETLLPSVYTLHVKETAQLREARAFFDTQKGVARFWEKKVTEKEGEQEKKLEWEIAPFSQNVFSSIYYMRVFQWEQGQENAFRVADDGENLIFRGKTVRREKLSVPAGEFNAIVVRPEIELKGKFKPVGDILIWLSDDDRKLILKIQSKIKIGSLTSEATEINSGLD